MSFHSPSAPSTPTAAPSSAGSTPVSTPFAFPSSSLTEPLSNIRKRGVSVSVPIVYGNSAILLSKKEGPNESHTHRWTVYLRGSDGEDISYFIKKVIIKLHDSFAQPLRTLEQPPYEVTETGWGEFEVQIKIFFKDNSEKPVTLYHHLSLRPHEFTIQASKKLLISEQYDELVFNDPTERLHAFLVQKQRNPQHRKQSPARNYTELEQQQLQQLQLSKEKVHAETEKYKARYKLMDDEAQKLKAEIAQLEQELQLDTSEMDLS